eukprot:g2775.t1
MMMEEEQAQHGGSGAAVARRKVCVVTGSRAEYGDLKPVMRALDEAEDFELQIVLQASMLSEQHGAPWRLVLRDGFHVDYKIHNLVQGECPAALVSAGAIGLQGCSAAFLALQPDLVIVYGDRYEIVAVANACLLHGIPLAHMSGGDCTTCAIDDCVRHAVTKLSHIHFPVSTDAAARIAQMGEPRDRIHTIGSPGLAVLRSSPKQTREWVEKKIEAKLSPAGNMLVIFHPVTLEAGKAEEQFMAVLDGVRPFLERGFGAIFIEPNADAESGHIRKRLHDFADACSRATPRLQTTVFSTLPWEVFINVVHHADVVVGNSSCGLIEVPTLKTATVNIGNRQLGRLHASSVVTTRKVSADAITAAIEEALALDCSNTTNFYEAVSGGGEALVRILRGYADFKELLVKPFATTAETDETIKGLFRQATVGQGSGK